MSTYKVNIVGPGGRVVFQASSPVSESRSASYDPYGIVHLPTSLWAYRSTSGRKFQVQGKIVSRTPNEAGANAGYLNLIRKWILPDFGGTGATPPIVFFSAYNNDNIDRVQCVISAYSWNFPEDVDYIYSGSVPMPIIGALSVDLEEVYSAEQITAGNWAIKDRSSGSFNDNSGPAGGGSLGIFGSLGDITGGYFGGIANQQMSSRAGGAGGFGDIGSGGFGLGAFSSAGNMLGSALGSANSMLSSVGGAINDTINSTINQSTLIRDVTNTALNVFQGGITQATIADQTYTPQEAFRNSELIAQRDNFQRDANPAPPDLADFYG